MGFVEGSAAFCIRYCALYVSHSSVFSDVISDVNLKASSQKITR